MSYILTAYLKKVLHTKYDVVLLFDYNIQYAVLCLNGGHFQIASTLESTQKMCAFVFWGWPTTRPKDEIGPIGAFLLFIIIRIPTVCYVSET